MSGRGPLGSTMVISVAGIVNQLEINAYLTKKVKLTR